MMKSIAALAAIVLCASSMVTERQPTDLSHLEILPSPLFARDLLTSDTRAGVSVQGTFTTASSTFIIPVVTVPKVSEPNVAYTVAAYVSIELAGCTGAAVRVGVILSAENDQSTCTGFYQWTPGNFTYLDYEALSLSSGNRVTMTVSTTSDTAGTITITNVSKKKRVTQELKDQAVLCRGGVSWLMEPLGLKTGGTTPVPYFGSVLFDNLVPKATNPQAFNLVDADNKPLINCLSKDDEHVTCDNA